MTSNALLRKLRIRGISGIPGIPSSIIDIEYRRTVQYISTEKHSAFHTAAPLVHHSILLSSLFICCPSGSFAEIILYEGCIIFMCGIDVKSQAK